MLTGDVVEESLQPACQRQHWYSKEDRRRFHFSCVRENFKSY